MKTLDARQLQADSLIYFHVAPSIIIMSVARYTLRASPATGIGGMYATAQGEGIPVVTAPLNPEFAGQQNVSVSPPNIHLIVTHQR